LGEPALAGDLETGQTHAAQLQHHGHLGTGGWRGLRAGRELRSWEANDPFAAVAGHPLGHRAFADMKAGCGPLPCQPLLEYLLDHRYCGTFMWRSR
jgi:hypothetical protein